MVAEQARRCPELGLSINPEELRRGLDDGEIWAQEFCNVPMEDGSQYIPLPLLLACESTASSAEWNGVPVDRLAKMGLTEIYFFGYSWGSVNDTTSSGTMMEFGNWDAATNATRGCNQWGSAQLREPRQRDPSPLDVAMVRWIRT